MLSLPREILLEIAFRTPLTELYNLMASSKATLASSPDLHNIASVYNVPYSKSLPKMVSYSLMPMAERLVHGDLEYVRHNLKTMYEVNRLLEKTQSPDVFEYVYDRLMNAHLAVGGDANDVWISPEGRANAVILRVAELDKLTPYIKAIYHIRLQEYREAMSARNVSRDVVAYVLNTIPDDLALEYLLSLDDNAQRIVIDSIGRSEGTISHVAKLIGIKSSTRYGLYGYDPIIYEVDPAVLVISSHIDAYILSRKYNPEVIKRSLDILPPIRASTNSPRLARINAIRWLALVGDWKLASEIAGAAVGYGDIKFTTQDAVKADNIEAYDLAIPSGVASSPVSERMLLHVLEKGDRVSFTRCEYDYRTVLGRFPDAAQSVLENKIEDLAIVRDIVKNYTVNMSDALRESIEYDALDTAKYLINRGATTNYCALCSLEMLHLVVDELGIDIDNIDIEGDDVISEAIRMGYTSYSTEDSTWDLQQSL